MTTWEIIAEKAKELPPEKQLEVLDFLEFLRMRSEESAERRDWILLSGRGLEAAFGKNEPDYSLDLIEEANPDYEGR